MHHGRVVGDHLIHHGLQGTGIGDLLEPALLDHGIRVVRAFPQGLEHFLGLFGGDGAVLDAEHHLTQLPGVDRTVPDIQVGGVQKSRQFPHDPVGRRFGVPADRGGLLEITRHGGTVPQYAGVVVRQPVLLDEALVAGVG